MGAQDPKPADPLSELLGALADGLDTGPPALATIARFEVIRTLGEGGFGAVFEAYDKHNDRRVALKLLRRASPEALLRFKREFRSLADIVHPNLVCMYELLQVEDHWLLTMELIEGRPFNRYLGAHPEKLREAFGQLVRGLSALHAAGKLHRDIKPSNVMVAEDGRVVVLDFGLVRELTADESTAMVGTPHFMSPEQCADQPLTQASDWYAVGVMLYQAISGQLPFEGKPLEVLKAKQTQQPELLTKEGALSTLTMRLLSIDPADRPDGEEIAKGFEVSVQAPRSAHELFGREAELRTLERALDKVRGGRPSGVFIFGPPGIGKSALVETFVESASQQDTVVLSGRCYERESVPYKALDSVVDALATYLRHLPKLQAATLVPRWAHELALLFPVLATVDAIANAPQRTQMLGPEVRRRAFVALKELLGAIADGRPMIVAIDDLQWGDVDSARLLAELLGPPDPPSMLFLGNFRSEEAEQSVLFKELAHSFEADDKLEIGLLSAEQTLALAKRLLGDREEDLAAKIAEESNGHPLLLKQLVDHLDQGEAGDEPLSLSGVIRARFSQLSREEQALLNVIAIAGRPTPWGIVRRAANLDRQERQGVEALGVSAWIRTQGPNQGPNADDHVEVFHDRIRETLTTALSEDEARALHRSLGEVIEALEPKDAEALAGHFVAAGLSERAIPHAVEAAERAEEAFAFDQAARWFQRLLEIAPAHDEHHRWCVRLAESLSATGRSTEAAATFLEAAEAEDDVSNQISFRCKAAAQLLLSGRMAQGLDALKDALSQVGIRYPPTPSSALRTALWELMRLSLQGMSWQARPGEISPEAQSRLDALNAGTFGLALIDIVRAGSFNLQATRFALDSGRLRDVLHTKFVNAGFTACAGGQMGLRRGRALFVQAKEEAQGVDDPFIHGLRIGIDGLICAYEGQLVQATERMTESLEVYGNAPQQWGEKSIIRILLEYPLGIRGCFSELRRHYYQSLRDARNRGDLLMETMMRRFCVLIPLADDDIEEARRSIGSTRWSHPENFFSVQHEYELEAHAQIALYEGGGGDVLSAFETGYEALQRSILPRALIFLRTLPNFLRGRLALASAPHLKRPKQAYRIALRSAEALEREGLGYTDCWALSLRAGLAAALGESATSMLRDLIVRADENDLTMVAAASRRRLSRLTGGDEGTLLLSMGDEAMAREGVRNADRMTQLYAPGYEPS